MISKPQLRQTGTKLVNILFSTFSLWKTRLPPVGNENAMGDGRGNGRDIIVETTMLHRHS